MNEHHIPPRWASRNFIVALTLLSCASREESPKAPEVTEMRAAEASGSSTQQGSPMRFFVASRGVDKSAKLGGLAGADAHCQSLARDAGAGELVWRAYLSTSPVGDRPGENARERVGHGPWYNAKGGLIARNLDELHSDRNGIMRESALTERGEIPETSHDILTGSDEEGRLAWSGGVPATCANWTTSGEGIARVGHSDRMDSETFENPRFKYWHGSWSSEHDTVGCGAPQLARTGGAGLFYCFASDRFDPHRDGEETALEFGFTKGINVNHWLGDNLPPTMLANAHYGAAWFDEEDVRWIAARGFDHIRVWVAGHRWVDESGHLNRAALEPFDRLLGWAKSQRLGVVLGMYSTPGYRAVVRGEAPAADASSPFTDGATRRDAAYLWWLVARRYARERDALRFELMVQPDAPNAQAMQAFNREALAAIRRTSPARVVYLTSHDEAGKGIAEIDLSDPNTAVSVRIWDAKASAALVEEQAADLAERLRSLAPRPLYIAEFGVFKKAEDAVARRYLGTARAAFEKRGFGWAVYDYHTGYAARDHDGNATRVIEGLFRTESH